MSHDQSTANPYRKVSVTTWSDRKVLSLSPLEPSGQALFLMLMVGPQSTNIPGLQPVGRLAFAEQLSWEPEAFDKAFAEVFREGLAKADWKARLVFVPNAIKHNLPQSPNVVKSWSGMWSRVPECELKVEAWHAIHRALQALGDSFAEAFKSACPLEISLVEPSQITPPSELAAKATGKPSSKATDNQEAVNSKQELRIKDPIGSLSTSQSTVDQPGLDGIPDAADQPKARAGVPPCPYDALIDLYHELCPTMAAVRRELFKTGKRGDAMLARWKWVMTANAEVGENAGNRMATTTDEGLAWFRRFFAYAAESAFLRGERSGGDGRSWSADLGWLMVLSNFEKVLEGKYHAEEREAAHA